jgi:hypothetical protein
MNRRAALAALLLLAPLLRAQSSRPAEVTVRAVNDRRTSGSFAQLDIRLELPKVRSSEVAASRVIVSAARDNTGADLADPEAGKDLEPNMRMAMGGEENNDPVNISVTLKMPSRKATTVKEVRGEIELYMPSKDPNSVAQISKFTSLAGKPLSHRALKANGVTITILTPAQLADERKRLGEIKRKEAQASGYTGEDLDAVVASYLEGLLSVEPSDVAVRISDPQKRIQEITYIDAAGETKRVSSHDDQGITVLSTWGEAPAPDWKLQVSMKTPKNVIRQPFTLANVALP